MSDPARPTPVPTAADVVVIGAGPAGLAAAAEAVHGGAEVVLVDASPRLGGQYWRHSARDEPPASRSPSWHHDWSIYRDLHETLQGAVRDGRLTHLASRHVWALDVDLDGPLAVRTVPLPESGNPQKVAAIMADAVVLCPGTYDRQLPVPGWTLPGVMSAGGVQAFVKTQALSPGRRVLLAGTGPFLVAAAATVLQAGAEVAAVCEAADLKGWFPRGASAALVPSKGMEGAGYVSLMARHRVPYLRRHVVTALYGEHTVRAARISRVNAAGSPQEGSSRILDDLDVVGLSWGFVPQSELLLQTGAATRLDADGSLVGVVDTEQASSVPGLFLAGEITGVTGAAGAVAEGRIAGRAAAGGGQVRRRDSAARARHRIFARAMHHAHPIPPRWADWMQDETIVCRCEEVTYQEIAAARDDLALVDPRSLKGSTRAGMGRCQGRMCGFAMTCLATQSDSRAERHLDAARQVSARPLALPLTVGALAEAPVSPPSDRGEDRSTPGARGGRAGATP